MSVNLNNILTEYGCKDLSSAREVFVDCSLSFLQLRDSLLCIGEILLEDQDSQLYVASVRAGFRDMNSAVVALQLQGNKLHAMAYAKEGAINQGICEKALKKLTDVAHGIPPAQSKPKWIFPSILALIIVVTVVSIGRGSFFPDKSFVDQFPNSSTATENHSSSTASGKPTPSDPQEEIPSPEELAFITEVELTIEATKAYNEAVNLFNANVAEYNEVVKLTSIENIEGLPSSLEPLLAVSESFEDNAEVVRGTYGREQISSDTATVLDMAEQVAQAVALVKQITAPAEEWVIERLNTVESITGSQAVTEAMNPDGLLGKDGGYSSCIYFTVAAARPNEVLGNSIVAKGTDAGGAVEVYPSLADAETRVEYLSGFDGTVLYSGSYAIVGTMVIRTSYKLSNEQQFDLTNAITTALAWTQND